MPLACRLDSADWLASRSKRSQPAFLHRRSRCSTMSSKCAYRLGLQRRIGRSLLGEWRKLGCSSTVQLLAFRVWIECALLVRFQPGATKGHWKSRRPVSALEIQALHEPIVLSGWASGQSQRGQAKVSSRCALRFDRRDQSRGEWRAVRVSQNHFDFAADCKTNPRDAKLPVEIVSPRHVVDRLRAGRISHRQTGHGQRGPGRGRRHDLD